MSPGERARALAIPLLVVLLAGLHAHRTIALDQSSWGAGQPLGMFGRVDSHGSRVLRVEAIGPDGRAREIPLPHGLDDLALQLRVAPRDPARMRALLDAFEAPPGERVRVTIARADGETIVRSP